MIRISEIKHNPIDINDKSLGLKSDGSNITESRGWTRYYRHSVKFHSKISGIMKFSSNNSIHISKLEIVFNDRESNVILSNEMYSFRMVHHWDFDNRSSHMKKHSLATRIFGSDGTEGTNHLPPVNWTFGK